MADPIGDALAKAKAPRGKAPASKMVPQRKQTLPPQPSLEPVGYKPKPNTAAQMAAIKAQVIANEALKTLAPDIAASRAGAPGPAVSGYPALSALLGPNIAARIPGTLTPAGTRPHPSVGGTALDAALLIPGLRPLKAVGALARNAKTVLTAEEAAQKVVDASRVARAQGYGRAGASEIPALKPGEVTSETGGDVGAQVRSALKGAPEARTAQKALYRTERAKRFGRAETALENPNPRAAMHQVLTEFKGELPKVNFQGFKEFNQQTLDEIVRHIKESPALSVPEKARGYQSLENATKGIVPTASEQRVLEKVFGRDTAQSIAESAPLWKRLGRGALSVVNVPRALQASFDLSFPLRQGLVAGAAHPRIWANELRPMVKMAMRPSFYDQVQQAIREMPTYPLMEKAGVSITGFGASLADREEPFMSRLLQGSVTVKGRRLSVPIVGHGMRFSERGYVGMANKLRADLFNDAIRRAALAGEDIHDPKVLQDIGRVVNAFTGRGDLGALQKAAPLLNTVFFSPRLLASRLNLIFGVGEHGVPGEYYLSLSPFARREALMGMQNLLAGLSTALYLAKLSGARVNMDPTNADFAKIRIGNTRIDLTGGFQQPVRLMAQVFRGKITSSTTGKTLSISQHGYGKLSRKDVLQRFIEGKYAPVPSTINDVLSNRTFQGGKVTLGGEAYAHLVPLLAQDVKDLFNQSGPAAAAGGVVLGGLGLGLQTYGPQIGKGSDPIGKILGGAGSAPAIKAGGDPIGDALKKK